MFNLAILLNGKGDRQEPKRWYRRAAETGHEGEGGVIWTSSRSGSAELPIVSTPTPYSTQPPCWKQWRPSTRRGDDSLWDATLGDAQSRRYPVYEKQTRVRPRQLSLSVILLCTTLWRFRILTARNEHRSATITPLKQFVAEVVYSDSICGSHCRKL